MPNCPRCKKAVYHAEGVHSLNQDWHGPCMICANETCKNKRLTASNHVEIDGIPYCFPCNRELIRKAAAAAAAPASEQPAQSDPVAAEASPAPTTAVSSPPPPPPDVRDSPEPPPVASQVPAAADAVVDNVNKIVLSEVAAKFAEHEITPNIITNPPKNKLDLNFESIPVELGMTLSTRNLRFAPKWRFNADPESTYSLVMIDPDNLSREKPTVAEWLHWLVANIPASNLLEGINGGQHQMAYGSPGPQPRTGLHRYIILLYEHQGRRISVPVPAQRAKFNVKQFAEKFNLGDPIAGNFFFAQHEG